MRINYLILAPWVVFTIPPDALYQQSIPIAIVVAVLGLTGMLTANRTSASLASATLLLLIIWGKIARDIYHLPPTDTALLLLQFMAVIFLMEASTTALTFESTVGQLAKKDDGISRAARIRGTKWASLQLLNLGKLTLTASALSLALLVMGSIVSVSVNQLAVSGVLVMAAFIAILFLLTFRREPETRAGGS